MRDYIEHMFDRVRIVEENYGTNVLIQNTRAVQFKYRPEFFQNLEIVQKNFPKT